MILGAAVADAAALGLHWIYSQPRVRRVAGDTPEFLEPDPANYEGVPSYFAHGGRRAGDGSMYGEGLLTTLRSVVERGRFDWQHYARTFEAHFGFGGEYVGYIDTPTRETLTNMLVRRRATHERAMSTPFDGSEKEKRTVAGKVLEAAERTRGGELGASVEDALRAAGATESQRALSRSMIDRIEESRDFPGADDEQLPAVTAVPVLIATESSVDDTAVEEAVRVTNNNDRAVAWAHFVARLLRWALSEEANIDGLEGGIRSALDGSPDHIVAVMETVLKQKRGDNKAVTMKVGPACRLASGVPAALHNLLGARSFVDAARRNILASGDSCGRAMVVGSLGAVLFSDGAEIGIPEDWLARLNRGRAFIDLIGTLEQR